MCEYIIKDPKTLDGSREYKRTAVQGSIYCSFHKKKVDIQKGVGKIDLVSKKDNVIYLIELKKPSSPESILRSMLEIQTYSKQLDSNQ